MSDSDDTDVLLLIPPDFFVVNTSDSEDSDIGFRNNSQSRENYQVSSSRVDDLINQVNVLEERISFIESKENLYSDSLLAEKRQYNESFDCAVSLDSTKFHNLGRSDLALRFYSMSSTDYRLGQGGADGISLHCPQTNVQNVPGNMAQPVVASSYPNMPYSDPPNKESTHKDIADGEYLPLKQTASLEQLVYGNNAMTCIPKTDISRNCIPVKERMKTGRKHDNQFHNLDFLSEIDEFLENRRKQPEIPMQGGECNDNSSDRIKNVNKLDIGMQSSSNIPSSSAVLKPKTVYSSEQISQTASQTMDLSHIDKLLSDMEAAQKEIENKLRSREQNLGYQDVFIEKERMPQNLFTACIRNLDMNNDISVHYDFSGTQYQLDQENAYRVGSGQETMHSTLLLPSSTCLENGNDKKLEKKCPNDQTSELNRNRKDRKDPQEPCISVSAIRSGPDDACDGNLLSVKWNQDSATGSHSVQNAAGGTIIEREIGKQKEHFISSTVESLKKLSYPEEGKNASCIEHPSSDILEATKMLYTNDSKKILHENESLTKLNTCERTNRIPYLSEGVTSSSVQYNDVDCDLKKLQINHLEAVNTQSLTVPPASNFQKKCSYPSQSQQTVSEIIYNDPENSSGQRTEYITKPRDEGKKYVNPPKKHVEFSCESVVNQGTLKTHPEIGFTISEGMLNKIVPRGLTPDDGLGSSAGTISSATNLLSLSDLWGSESGIARSEHMTLEQKLEEERYRRQHCEQLIHHLQMKLLEEQQRIAVAMRVDRGKDQAIVQLQDAWSRLVAHWHELEEQRHYLASQLSGERSNHQQERVEMAQKVKQYEQELSKVLDLAQGYKEKSEAAEQRNQESEKQYTENKEELEAKLQETQSRLVKAGQDIGQMCREMDHLQESLQSSEEEVNKGRELVKKLQEETKKNVSELNSYEAELAAAREENNSLQLRLKEERSKIAVLEQQKKSLQIMVDESKKKEKLLCGELKEKGDLVDKVKLELRDYYQEQVEAVVREKLQEFQMQLDTAEVALQREMEEHDKAAAEEATRQIQQITDKHQLEVRLLEEKHNEELQLYQLQLTQATQQISQLQARLQGYSHRKTELVEKLHGVMETQWQEALRIISGNSPVVHPSPFESRMLKTINSDTRNIPVRDSGISREEYIPSLHVSQNSACSSTADEMPFSKEGQQTYRMNEPVKSIPAMRNEDNDLRKYIRMLLNRSPGNPIEVDASVQSENHDFEVKSLLKLERIQDLQHIAPSLTSNAAFDVSKSSHMTLKDGRSNKPPWK